MHIDVLDVVSVGAEVGAELLEPLIEGAMSHGELMRLLSSHVMELSIRITALVDKGESESGIVERRHSSNHSSDHRASGMGNPAPVSTFLLQLHDMNVATGDGSICPHRGDSWSQKIAGPSTHCEKYRW